MFTSKEEKKESHKLSTSTNAIGRGTVLEGNIETHGNIRIEGKILGDIKSKAKVVLGDGGCVQGNIVANNADIEGEVKGKIEVLETLTMKSKAVVHADIITGKLVVESGAVFNGGCKMGAVMRDIKMKENERRGASIFGPHISKSG